MSTAELDGISVAYDDLGTGLPLVLVHGHPFNRTMWRPQAERFGREGYRVVTADLRGYGETTVVPGKTGLDVFAADIARLADHLGLDRFVLGGLSMGGQIVMEFQRTYPDRVAGLLLADTSPQEETEEGKRVRNAMADRVLAEGIGPYADEVLTKMVSPTNVRTQPDVAAHVLRMMRTTPREGAAAALRGRAERPDYRETLAKVTVPSLIVVGTEDEYTPVSDAELMHELIPGSTLAVIEGAAHMPNLEREAEFNAVFARFLKEIG
ncbi:alpha/beta fold hydrolase [Amycolatopsis regifaucium]|uniref:Hydrolase n=1 Tax=Amycolatopsis regifaucium TaxID=546365 RepID=A0A154M843_9PSEU|nr:alpha/beta fold hydrolase [Amycolatopsis regifaucium]KZB79999.1 hydrolase [Amycolatopsis regifaucium]OKA09631.1 alpha/beta hydrolase [Amycolatopsis regifaucium]SFH67002.1 Pimeloyl-ACP methyl ester carboxylesterase [Amycolatopsis regifaucium]